MTAPEILAKARNANPNRRWAISANGTALGCWEESEGRFVPVSLLGLDRRWYIAPDREILVNGQPIVRTWKE